MEKYTNFSDTTTGCNPFIPTWVHHRRKSLTLNLVFYFIIFIIFLPRILLIVFCALVLFVLHLVAQPLYPFYSLYRNVCWLTHYIPLRCVMLCLGIWDMKLTYADLRQVEKARPQKKEQISDTFSIQRDTIILCNSTNFAEILYLTLYCYPFFVKQCANNTLDIIPWFYALSASLQHKTDLSTQKGRFQSLVDLHLFTKKKGPVVIFPEFSKSNGTALLLWSTASLFPNDRTKQRLIEDFYTLCRNNVRLAGFSYPNHKFYNLPHTVYHPVKHLFFLLTQDWNYRMEFVLTSQKQIQWMLEKQPTQSMTHTFETFRSFMSLILNRSPLVDIKDKHSSRQKVLAKLNREQRKTTKQVTLPSNSNRYVEEPMLETEPIPYEFSVNEKMEHLMDAKPSEKRNKDINESTTTYTFSNEDTLGLGSLETHDAEHFFHYFFNIL